MSELFNKLSSYNLFNNLLPGTLFVFLAGQATHHDYIQPNLPVALALYYLVGLVVGRFGSLVVEPILRRTKFLQFAEYKEFVEASKKDEKIEIMSEVNNMYRTLCSLFSMLLLLVLYTKLTAAFPLIASKTAIILSAALLITFAFSYRKQTQYITKRIKVNL
jgi:hypothetical protein